MQHTHAQLKRYNHLLGELEAVYHDLSYQLGMSDSVSKILYTLCCEGSPCRISDICLCSGLSKQTPLCANWRLRVSSTWNPQAERQKPYA